MIVFYNYLQQPVPFTCDGKYEVEPGDILKFELTGLENDRPMAENAKISKYHGFRYTAHVEQLAEDIFACSVCHEETKDNIEV